MCFSSTGEGLTWGCGYSVPMVLKVKAAGLASILASGPHNNTTAQQSSLPVARTSAGWMMSIVSEQNFSKSIALPGS